MGGRGGGREGGGRVGGRGGWEGGRGGKGGREGERWDGMYTFTTLSLVHRCTMTSDEPNVGTARLRMALRQWAMEEQTIKLGDDIEVMVSSSCTDIIPSSPCEVVEVSTAGLRDFSSGSAAAVVFALLLVVAVMVCVVLLVLLMVLYRRSRRRQWYVHTCVRCIHMYIRVCVCVCVCGVCVCVCS